MAGMTMIPAYVREADDQGMLEMALVENIQRENLDPIETALCYQRLIDECRLTQDAMADRVGKKRSSVTNTIRLLKLPVKVQHDLKVGILSVGHAKVLLSVDDPKVQEELCDITIKDDLSVRALENLVRKYLRQAKPSVKKEQELPEEYSRMLSCLGRYFSNDISLRRSPGGKGSLTIRFDSDDEISRFLQAIENQEN